MAGWKLILRDIRKADRNRALELAQCTAVFRPAELAVLEEVVDDYLRAPGEFGYHALALELTSSTATETVEAAPTSEESEEAEATEALQQTVSSEERARSELVGFIIYGPTPLTLHTWDIYWVVVGKEYQGRGLGSRLLEAAEMRIRAQRGEVIRVETSSSPGYAQTRRFYEKHSYQCAGVIPDFYAPGDDLVIYYKRLEPHHKRE